MTPDILRLSRKLKAAKSRALYWSGVMSFCGYGFIPNGRSANGHDAEYEMALDDIESLCEQLEAIDGRPRKRYDPKGEFSRRYAEVMALVKQ